MKVTKTKVKFNIPFIHDGQAYAKNSEALLNEDDALKLVSYEVTSPVRSHLGSLDNNGISIKDQVFKKMSAVDLLGTEEVDEVDTKKHVYRMTQDELNGRIEEAVQKALASYGAKTKH